MIEGLTELSIENILTFDQREEIAKFLRDEGLSELIVQKPNESTATIIKQKIDFITITTAANLGHDLKGITRRNIRFITHGFSPIIYLPQAALL